ncbi:MAG: AAA family ATPase [Acidimicrobiia bacterium]|nr:AAA family ATPase [Acidimicrobiia bacterium]
MGPRGCGKSTSMRQFADTVLDLSTPGVRTAAIEEPDGILASAAGRVLIDEWQENPEILGAIKQAVDTDLSSIPDPFIVTGSVRAVQQVATRPGTGRLIRVRMSGLTQGELENDDFSDPVGKPTGPVRATAPSRSTASISPICRRNCWAGGEPEASARFLPGSCRYRLVWPTTGRSYQHLANLIGLVLHRHRGQPV